MPERLERVVKVLGNAGAFVRFVILSTRSLVIVVVRGVRDQVVVPPAPVRALHLRQRLRRAGDALRRHLLAQRARGGFPLFLFFPRVALGGGARLILLAKFRRQRRVARAHAPLLARDRLAASDAPPVLGLLGHALAVLLSALALVEVHRHGDRSTRDASKSAARRRRSRFDTERARGAGCASRNSGDARAPGLHRGRARRVGRRDRRLGALVTTRSRVGLAAEEASFGSRRRRRIARASETSRGGIESSHELLAFLIGNGDTSYASSSSSSRGYGTEACPLQAKPVYPLRRAWMLPTASSLTLKLHVRGCQDDQEENS